jgi:hypothetical protein
MVVCASSPAVVSRYIHLRVGVRVVASQNVTNPALGTSVPDRLNSSETSQQALQEVLAAESHLDFRQISVVVPPEPRRVILDRGRSGSTISQLARQLSWRVIYSLHQRPWTLCPKVVRIATGVRWSPIVEQMAKATILPGAPRARLGRHQQRLGAFDRKEQAALQKHARLQEQGWHGQRHSSTPMALQRGRRARPEQGDGSVKRRQRLTEAVSQIYPPSVGQLPQGRSLHTGTKVVYVCCT